MESGLLIGGRYRLRERLGHGGMSVVWRATDDVLGRDVAVKVLHGSLAADRALLRHLHDEARAAAGLRHAYVVEVYDYGETGYGGATVPYVVMELVDGQSVADLLAVGALPWHPAVQIGAQVAAALAAAHDRGVVHRDVKPANVMVTAAGVKLVDFGISAATGDPDELLGTPAYLAPERIAGGAVRPATDVYALGLLLYLMLAGRLPWQASTSTEMLRAHRYYEPAPLPPVEGLPSAAPGLIARCLAKRPGDRPSAAEVADRLSELADLPSAAADPTVPLPAPPRHRRALVAAAAGALLVGGLGVWQMNGRGSASAAAPAPSSSAPGACTVRYALRGTDPGRAATTVTIHNTGTRPVDGWRLTFSLPSGQKLLRGWSATWKQDGSAVLASGGSLAAGSSVATGFDAAYGEVAALPVAFLLNGTACRAEMSVQTPSVAPPPAPARAEQPAPPAAPPAAGPPGGDSGKHKGKGKGNSGPGSGGGDHD